MKKVKTVAAVLLLLNKVFLTCSIHPLQLQWIDKYTIYNIAVHLLQLVVVGEVSIIAGSSWGSIWKRASLQYLGPREQYPVFETERASIQYLRELLRQFDY